MEGMNAVHAAVRKKKKKKVKKKPKAETLPAKPAPDLSPPGAGGSDNRDADPVIFF